MFVKIKSVRLTNLAAVLAFVLGAAAARAGECGPDRLGTSRIVEIGTQGGLSVGLKTYPKAIPLADHEVILTFDDGPDSSTTPLVLEALARECARATFFDIGRKARRSPTSSVAKRPKATPSPITPTATRSRRCAA